VVKTLQLYDIAFCDVIVFDTDNAAYMKKAYKSVLSPLFPNSVHITCLAHIVNLVGESFRSPFVEVNEFVRAFSQMFFMAGARKGRYLQYIKEHKTDTTTVTMPPDPCAVRWNSWYFAVQYQAKNFQLYKGFIESELIVCGRSSPQSVQTLSTILTSENALNVAAQISFIAEKCQPILHFLDKLESHTPCTMNVFDWLEELQIYLESHAQISHAIHLTCFDTLSLHDRMKNDELFCTAFQCSAEKLLKYMSESGTDYKINGQPGIKFLKAVRIFDPKKVCLLSQNLTDYSGIPTFCETVPPDEFHKYISKYAPEAVADAGGIWSDTNVDYFWNSMNEKLPNICSAAKTDKDAVCNSADAERSNSLYNLILSERRRSLAEKSIKALLFLYYNKGLMHF
jgi:hypothetical protein